MFSIKRYAPKILWLGFVGLVLWSIFSPSGERWVARIERNPNTTLVVLAIIIVMVVIQIIREFVALRLVNPPATWQRRKYDQVPDQAKAIIPKMFSFVIYARLIAFFLFLLAAILMFRFSWLNR